MALVLLLLFIVIPLAELYVIIQVGGAIGVLPTIGILLLDSFLGAALLRSQGRVVWRRFNEALAAGRVPARETFDGAMVILGGALLLTPGFITDVVGLICLIPPTRDLLRALSVRLLKGRVALGPRVAHWGYRRARGRRQPSPGAPPGGPYADSWGTPRTPGGAPPPAPGGRPGDIEGTAREVDDEDPELGAGR